MIRALEAVTAAALAAPAVAVAVAIHAPRALVTTVWLVDQALLLRRPLPEESPRA